MYTDTSDVGLGAVLSQDTPEGKCPIFFMSQKLTSLEQRYADIEKEALAMHRAIKEFRYYLWGQKFTVVTNHAPLQWLTHLKVTNPHLIRWHLDFQLYSFTVCYRRGWDCANADFFSLQAVRASLNQLARLKGYVFDTPDSGHIPGAGSETENPASGTQFDLPWLALPCCLTKTCCSN